MTDTEGQIDQHLLELAAKAAGIEIIGLVDKMIAQPDHRTNGFIIRNDRGGDSCWNPLTDDGDALRLAVKLGLSLTLLFEDGTAEIYYVNKRGFGNDLWEQNTSDPYAATRRAVVRAAAEIGKTL